MARHEYQDPLEQLREAVLEMSERARHRRALEDSESKDDALAERIGDGDDELSY